MFKRLAAWLRGIISEEVAKVSSTITKERAESIATLKNVEAEIRHNFSVVETTFQKRVREMLDAEHDAFVVRLRATREHIGNGEPSRWQADAETVAADHGLKFVK